MKEIVTPRGKDRYTPKRWKRRTITTTGTSISVNIPQSIVKDDRRIQMDHQRWSPGDEVEVTLLNPKLGSSNAERDVSYILIRYDGLANRQRGRVMSDIQVEEDKHGGVTMTMLMGPMARPNVWSGNADDNWTAVKKYNQSERKRISKELRSKEVAERRKKGRRRKRELAKELSEQRKEERRRLGQPVREKSGRGEGGTRQTDSRRTKAKSSAPRRR